MLLLILDIETSKDAGGNDVPVEVAAVAYCTEHRTIVGTFSTLLYADVPAAADVHKIPVGAIQGWGLEYPTGGKIDIKSLLDLAPQFCKNDFSYLIAHNAEFEQKFIDGGDIPWLCTYKDFDLFPPSYNGKRDLISLAQWYGVGVSVSHRAIYDCLLLAEVFNRVPDLNKEIEYALRPKMEWLAPQNAEPPPLGFRWDYALQGWIGKQASFTKGSVFAPVGDRQEFIACVDYDTRQIAKDWGFQWDAENKLWTRLANPDLVSLFPFEVQLAYIKPLEGTLKADYDYDYDENYDYSQNPLIDDSIYGSSS